MSTHHSRALTVLFAASLFCGVGILWDSPGAATDSVDLQQVMRLYAQDLAALTDDAQALLLFTTRLGPALDLKDSVAILTSKPKTSEQESPMSNATETRKHALRFTKDLTVWRLTLGLLEAAETDPASLERFVREADSQLAWLTAEPRPLFTEAWHLASLLASVSAPQSGNAEVSSGYRDFAEAVDRASIRFTGSMDSWLAISEREGAEGVLARLRGIGGASSEADRAAFSVRYFHERLHPVLNAHLVARAIRAEADAERQAQEQWSRLRTLRDSLREQRGLARLCGTWQWTIHNHQNHGEHKMIMAFPPADSQPGAGPRPAKTVVLGDTVYLRWEFDRGIVQEDSLLFSGEGKRLEGTFINSGGAWGGITAKRTAPCAESAPAAPTSAGDSTRTPRPGRSTPR